MAVNKVIYGGNTLIDLTQDTITAADVLSGVTFHLPSGASGTGSCDYDVDSSDCTAVVAEVLSGKTFAKGGNILEGTMPNIGEEVLTIDDVDDELSISQGYHDGSGKAKLDATEKAKLIPGNIKSGVELLGVTGSYTGAAISAQTKTVTPSTSSQTVLPDSGYDYLSQVTVNAIPYTETDNAAGGKTVSIGTVAS